MNIKTSFVSWIPYFPLILSLIYLYHSDVNLDMFPLIFFTKIPIQQCFRDFVCWILSTSIFFFSSYNWIFLSFVCPMQTWDSPSLSFDFSFVLNFRFLKKWVLIIWSLITWSKVVTKNQTFFWKIRHFIELNCLISLFCLICKRLR